MRKLIKETASYVVFNYASQALLIARGFLLITILTPVSLGIYKLLFTYVSYFRYYNLGLNALAFYRAPPRKMQASYGFLLRKINLTLAWSLGLLFTLIFAILWWDALSSDSTRDYILWIFLILYFSQMAETYLTIAKVNKAFATINRYNVAFAVVSTVSMVVLGYFWQLRGVIVGLTLSTIVTSAYLTGKLGKGVRYSIRLTRWKIKNLFKHSLTTILPGMFIVLFTTVEIWIIAFRFGAAETGYYSVVATFVSIVLMLNTDGVVLLYSKRSQNFRRQPGFVLNVTAIAFFVIASVCFAGIIIVPKIIEMFFPDYLRASAIYLLCFWGIPFLVARNIVVSYISQNRSIFISTILAALLVTKSALLLLVQTSAFYLGLAATNAAFAVVLIMVYVLDRQRAFNGKQNAKNGIT